MPGVVTGVRTYGSSKGFWFQDPDADDDPATSEGVFVYTGSAPKVAVGDAVTVTGTVSEYVPGGVASGNQSVTEITKATVAVASTGNPVPAATVVDARSVPDAYTPARRHRGGRFGQRPPARAGDVRPGLLRVPRRHERAGRGHPRGHRHRPVHRAVGHGEAARERDPPRRLRCTARTPRRTPDGSRSSHSARRPTSRPRTSATRSTGTTAGPLDYTQYGGYTLVANQLGTLEKGGLERETTHRQGRDELAVATYNVENLDPADTTFEAHASAIVNNLRSPDIVSLEEIQDNNGATDDGTVAADVTVNKLIDAIVAAGGPRYDWRSDRPGQRRGRRPAGRQHPPGLPLQPRAGVVHRPRRRRLHDRRRCEEGHGKAQLTASPGRVAPADAAWEDSRKPLAGEFVFRGKTVFVIANHFELQGRRPGADRRIPAAEAQLGGAAARRRRRVVNTFVKEMLAAQRNADVIALGDINDFEFSDTTKILEGDGALWSAIKSLPKNERYTYDYQGNAQVLDQILVSPSIRRGCDLRYDSVHINSEFSDQISDHDPQVLRFRP